MKKYNDKICLWIVGGGALRGELEKLIDKMNLSGTVRLFGTRNDVNDLLQASDLYVCPSFSEGLSISSIEAQASGLRLLESTGVPKEVDVTGRCEFMDLDAGAVVWADKIISLVA